MTVMRLHLRVAAHRIEPPKFGTSMEDSTSPQTSVFNCTNSTSVQNVVFRCEYLFYYSPEMNDNDGTCTLVPVICSP